MSLSIKFGSLVVRTLSKPVANAIKSQAKQYPFFKSICIGIAQTVHSGGIRMRQNLLKQEVQYDGEEDGGTGDSKSKARRQKVRIRPLNEAKAIENGANFISEAFLFSVAGGLILYESWRSRRKDTERRAGVADDIDDLQTRVHVLEDALQELRRGSGPAAPSAAAAAPAPAAQAPAAATGSPPA